MRFGIDFGTTRTVVAVCDRGNYPVLSFKVESGTARPYFPSVVAERGGSLEFGFRALARIGQAGWTVQHSFKRWLSSPDATLDRVVQVGSTTLPLVELVTEFLRAVKQAALYESDLPKSMKNGSSVDVEASVATPANAFSTQRLVTLEAFRRAGFRVLSMLSEPSAAGMEYAHRYRNTLNSKREKVLVYDLGGGTFDVSLVDMQGDRHDVVSSRGLSQLGGDDFDEALATVGAEKGGFAASDLSPSEWAAFRHYCRDLKEAIHANTRNVYVELGNAFGDELRARLQLAADAVASVPIAAYEQACQPMLDRTLELVREALVSGLGEDSEPDASGVPKQLAGLYVVGGASALPNVARRLRTEFGRRVRRSPYPSAAIAIGLAIAADEAAPYQVSASFQHYLGVFREARGGQIVDFDGIIGPDVPLPAPGGEPIRLSRRYRATHNVGHFRFVECGWLSAAGEPSGDIKPCRDILFPFDPHLRQTKDLKAIPVARSPGGGPEIEEQYEVHESGAVDLVIVDCERGYRQSYRIAG